MWGLGILCKQSRAESQMCWRCDDVLHVAEMPEDCLAFLSSCCSPAVLQSLELLVSTATTRKAHTNAQLNKFDQIFCLWRLSSLSSLAVPGALCVGERGGASEQRRPAWRPVGRGWTSFCLLQRVPQEGRGHHEDADPAAAWKPPSGPEHHYRRSGLTRSLRVTPSGWRHPAPASGATQSLHLSSEACVQRSCICCWTCRIVWACLSSWCFGTSGDGVFQIPVSHVLLNRSIDVLKILFFNVL